MLLALVGGVCWHPWIVISAGGAFRLGWVLVPDRNPPARLRKGTSEVLDMMGLEKRRGTGDRDVKKTKVGGLGPRIPEIH